MKPPNSRDAKLKVPSVESNPKVEETLQLGLLDFRAENAKINTNFFTNKSSIYFSGKIKTTHLYQS